MNQINQMDPLTLYYKRKNAIQKETQDEQESRRDAVARGADKSILQGQPDRGEGDFVYIASMKDRFGIGVAGVVCTADYPIAAKCILDGTHEIASAAQIAKHNAAMEERRARYRNLQAIVDRKTYVTSSDTPTLTPKIAA